MRNKEKETPVAPRLQGEDFDIFPDLGDRPAPTAEEAPAPEPEDEPGPTALQEKVAAIPDEKWKLYQLLGGILLGIICGLLISFGDKLFSGSVGVILAFGVALVLPNLLERQFARSLRRMRVVLAAALAVCLLASLAYGLWINPSVMAPA